MYASRSRCDSAFRSTFATSIVPSSSSTLYTSPMQPPPIGRAETNRSPRAAATPSATIFSDTAGRVLPLDLLQEPLRGGLDEIQYALEALRTTVEGGRDLALCAI